jgi:glycosyltransferase involved in cell wall biosynthesis
MNKILILRDFKEDRRMSMEIYADLLLTSLKTIDTFEVDGYIPTVPPLFNNLIGMRIARYLFYPMQVIGKKASLYHIIDPGYSHLINIIDKEKTIVTVHGLLPILMWKGKVQGIARRRIPLLLLFSFAELKKVKQIIAISEDVKKDLINLLGFEPNKICVINNVIDPIFREYSQGQKIETRNRIFGKNNPTKHILINATKFYKNPDTVLRTAKILQENSDLDFRLVRIGHPDKHWIDSVHTYGLQNNVVDLGPIQWKDMPDLYNSVDLLFFPSLYEGFGWPPLEAMACGTPVIASNATSLPEVIGDAGVMLDPYDVLGFFEAIRKMLIDQEYRQQFVEKGVNQARKFTWDKTIEKIISVYNYILCDY